MFKYTYTLYVVNLYVVVTVCDQEAEPENIIQARTKGRRAGSQAPLSAQTSQHCHIPGVMGRRGLSALYSNGFL